MKKRIAILLLAALLLGCLSGCGGKSVSKAAVVEGSIFGGSSDDRISVEISFDPDWLIKGDNKTYNPELAQFCALLSADSYFREKDLAKGRQNRVLTEGFPEENYDFTALLTEMGFTEAEHYESYLTQTDPTDSNDSVTLNIAHRTVGKYDLYAVAIRGCFSVQEWCSAFDPGCWAGYEALTGAHPEWTDKETFKGLDVAANRALRYIEDFMARTGDKTRQARLLITGHSRGGGIANLLGAHFEREGSAVPYTYTFNSLGVTCAADAGSYQTIFNIFDTGDFFTDALPFAQGALVRYGRDLSAAMAESDELRGAAAALKGRDDYVCVPAETAARYRSLFAQRFPDREMICEAESVERVYATREEAEAGREELLALIGSEGLGLENLCSVGEVEETPEGFSVTLRKCPMALLRSYALILAYGEAKYAPAVSLFAEDETGCAIAALLLENGAAISGGHLLADSYVIAGTMK